MQPGTKTAAHAALACLTLANRPSARSLLIVPFCGTDASVLFRISSLAVRFAGDVCTWQICLNCRCDKWGLQHIMHATGLACRQNAASGQASLVAAGLHRHDMLRNGASSPAKAMLEQPHLSTRPHCNIKNQVQKLIH